jgi:hypothetical protein
LPPGTGKILAQEKSAAAKTHGLASALGREKKATPDLNLKMSSIITFSLQFQQNYNGITEVTVSSSSFNY